MLKIAGLFVVVMLFLAGSSAFACYYGLTLIPTAETIGANQYYFDFGADGRFKTLDEDAQYINTQFGFGDRFDAGIDYIYVDGEKSEKNFNAKYVFAVDQKHATAYAAGICGVTNHAKSSPYMVATKDLQSFRFHFGGMRIDGNNRWFTGADREIAKNLTFMADYTAGDENYSSVGLNYQFNDSVGIYGSVVYPNGGGDTLFALHLTIVGPFK